MARWASTLTATMGYLPEAHAQLPRPPRLGPWRRRDHLERGDDRLARPARDQQDGGAFRFPEAREHQRPLPPPDARRGQPLATFPGPAPPPPRRGRGSTPSSTWTGSCAVAPGAAVPQGPRQDPDRPDRRRSLHRRGAPAGARRGSRCLLERTARARTLGGGSPPSRPADWAAPAPKPR